MGIRALVNVPALACVGTIMLLGPPVYAAEREPFDVEKRLSAQLTVARQVIEAATAELLGVSEVQKAIGSDLDALHTWVHENTRYVDYEGALKGASGTLQARQGNSLDRSLLLAALFDAAGAEVRLAQTSEPVDVIESLRNDAGNRESLPPIPDFELTANLLANARDESTPEAELLLQALRERDEATRQSLNDRAATLTAALDDVLAAVPFEPPAAISERAHWWVMARLPEQPWAPFDAAQAAFETDSLLAARTEIALADLDPALFHAVTLSVTVDIDNADGERRTETLLQHRFQSAREASNRGVLTFNPDPGLSMDELAAGMTGDIDAFLHEQLSRQTSWSPVLMMSDGSMITERAITHDGRVLERPPALLDVAKKVGDADALLGELNASATSEPAASEVAAWPAQIRLHWSVEAPGQADKLTHRVLYDREHHGAERLDLASTLSSRNAFLLQRADVPEALVTLEQARLLQRMELPLRYLGTQAEREATIDGEALSSILARLYAVPILPLEFAGERALRPAGQYLSEINIIVQHDDLMWRDDQSNALTGLDIVNLTTRTRGAESTPDMVAQRRLSSLRAALLETVIVDSADDAALHSLTPTDDIDWVVVSDAGQLEGIANPQLRETLTADLASDARLLLPDARSPQAWWRISADGSSLIANGWINGTTRGSTTTETAVKLWHSIEISIAMASFAKNTVACKGESAGCVLCAAAQLILKLASLREGRFSTPLGAAGDGLGVAC